MASVTHSIENSPTSTMSQAPKIKQESISIGMSWKAILRKKNQTKRPNQKLTPRLSESIKSKNIPKNVAKAIIQQILNNNVQEQIEEEEEFLKFINKHRKIQNLAYLMKITRPHKLEKLNKLHKQFRQICWNFLKKQYVPYIFNSRIKNPEGHLQYRNQLMKVFAQKQ
ncbi:unnamed protein product (macronuclear) [Paramecium tetraurelia]|uniref:Uncharacterized protein n=1 Tax=Paramecium tetraurelia TaxID=5888 RepID=A0BR06_PARTE|nr:uncharacterized protein GSPATT00031202001 [Paramecium tetraurelia]CAK60973.1 unnamed protein product [Paramecium tetraurelia]|eukprot:XP_001428371.1 hypothetical protein (macronuclear) [Paramecium tetraurelia strain d4-2]